MTQVKNFAFYLLLIFGLVATSCGKDNEPGNDGNGTNKDENLPIEITVQLPEEIEKGQLTDITVTMKDINTGKKYNLNPQAEGITINISVPKGLYDVTLDGNVVYQYDGQELKSKISGFKQSIEVVSTEVLKIQIPLFFDNVKEGFVLAELFFTGSQTPQGSYYFADKYFVIYNNSNETLYADSLAIAESNFMTVSKSNYTPNIMNEAMAVKALYMIPGNGKEHPVKPGESILICDNALNHQKANPNSFDLTKADFEWVDESTNPNISDVNNPDVPDMKKVYCSTKTVWSPHTQGHTTFALVRMKTDINTFLLEQVYNYEYTVVGATGELPMTGSCYKVPNSWIVDAVNVSVLSEFKWIVVDPSLDRGWTYCAEIEFDDSRLNKCVRRKVLSHTADGKAILKDTNNSTVDFEVRQKADPFYKF